VSRRVLCYVPPSIYSVTLQNKEELDSNSELDQVTEHDNKVKNEESGVRELAGTEKHDTDKQNTNEPNSEQKGGLKPGQVTGTSNTTYLQQKRKPRMKVTDVPFHMVQLKPVERTTEARSAVPEKTNDGKVGSALN
jgi:hypothetical protein